MTFTTTSSQKSLSQVLTQAINTKNPQVIFGKNEPVAVILDYTSYNIFLSLMDGLEEKGRYIDAHREAKREKGISLSQLRKKYCLK